MKMLDLKVINDSGIHARPSALIVESLLLINVSVTFEKNGFKVDAKSILNLLQLAASQGSIIHIEIIGSYDDELKTANILQDLFNSGFEKAYNK